MMDVASNTTKPVALETTTVQQLAGVPDGTEINGEVIVADKDSAGNIIGWHKQQKGGK